MKLCLRATMQCQQQANNARVRVNKIEQTVFITEQILIMNREQGIVDRNANNIERGNIKSHTPDPCYIRSTRRVQNYY